LQRLIAFCQLELTTKDDVLAELEKYEWGQLIELYNANYLLVYIRKYEDTKSPDKKESILHDILLEVISSRLSQSVKENKLSTDCDGALTAIDANQRLKEFLINQLYNKDAAWRIMFNIEELRGLPIPSVAFHPAGQLFAVSGFGDSIRFYNALTGEYIYSSQYENPKDDHKKAINAMQFSPCGTYLFTCSSDETAKLWTSGGELLYTLKVDKGSVTSCAFHPELPFVVVGGADSLYKLDIDSFKERKYQKNFPSIRSVAIAQDTIAVGHDNGSLTVIDKAFTENLKPQNLKLAENDCISSVQFYPDGSGAIFATCQKPPSIIKIKPHNGVYKKTKMLQFSGDNIIAASLSPNGKAFAVGCGKKVSIYDSSTLQLIREFTTVKPVDLVLFNPDGQSLLVNTYFNHLTMIGTNFARAGFTLESALGCSFKDVLSVLNTGKLPIGFNNGALDTVKPLQEAGKAGPADPDLAKIHKSAELKKESLGAAAAFEQLKEKKLRRSRRKLNPKDRMPVGSGKSPQSEKTGFTDDDDDDQ
jgi:WD40 repeat protein